MSGLIGPIIKAGLIGGGSVTCVYGVYKIATDISTTNFDDQGVDLFQKISKLQEKKMDLKVIAGAIQILNNEKVSTYLTKNSEKVEKIMGDSNKIEVVEKVFAGCEEAKHKNKATCKDIGTALDTIVEKLSKDAEKADPSPFTSWLSGDPDKVLKNFKEASSSQLIEYLEGVKTIESFQEKGMPAIFTKPMTAIYSWLKFIPKKSTTPNPIQTPKLSAK